MWEKPDCNNCGSKRNRIFLKDITVWEYPGLFTIVECKSCGLKYLSPRPKKTLISKYYSAKGYWGHNLLTFEKSENSLEKERELFYGKLYKQIFKIFMNGSILDVGAGTGIFLTKFKDLDWNVDGIELFPEAVDYAKKVYNIKLNKGNFNEMGTFGKKYDVVTFNSSLEHIYNPKKALYKAHYLLKKDGIVVVTVPNIESLGAKLLRKNWLPLDPPKHLYHFTEKTLTDMLNNCGFEVRKVSHWYFQHAYYGIYQSIRYTLSPKFSKKKTGGTVRKKESLFKKDIEKSFKKEIAKIMAILVALMITFIGAAFRKGETITIYAKKS